MGLDYYGFGRDRQHRGGIGNECLIESAIIDKNAVIGDGCQIVNVRKVDEEEGPNYHIRNGIVVVPKNAVIEPGTII